MSDVWNDEIEALASRWTKAVSHAEKERIRGQLHALHIRKYMDDEIVTDAPVARVDRPLIINTPVARTEPEPAWHGIAEDGEYEGFRNYRSPFPRLRKSGNVYFTYAWAEHRENYEKNGTRSDLESMLKCVTLDNPPNSSDIWMKTEKTGIYNTSQVWLGLLPIAIVIVTALVFAGILGGMASVVSVSVVLFLIVAIAWVTH